MNEPINYTNFLCGTLGFDTSGETYRCSTMHAIGNGHDDDDVNLQREKILNCQQKLKKYIYKPNAAF
jgi:hypothetical protein